MRRLAPVLVLLFAGCGRSGEPNDVWIYTSIYPEVIEQLSPELERAFPGVTFRWEQKGSEQIAATLNLELAAGRTPCDLLLTSDPFYYAELRDAGRLLELGEGVDVVPANLRDPSGAFATVRMPLMVLAVNPDHLPRDRWPTTFEELTDERFRGLVAMGDPGKSGTTFTTVAALSSRLGWDWFRDLADGDLLSAGGNSSVLQRLETGERPVGIILLENLLPRITAGAPLEVIYPEDGAVPIPSPVAVLQGTEDPELARDVAAWFLGETAQRAIVSGGMYSPVPGSAPPAGARALSEVRLFPWTPAFLEDVATRRREIRDTFREQLAR